MHLHGSAAAVTGTASSFSTVNLTDFGAGTVDIDVDERSEVKEPRTSQSAPEATVTFGSERATVQEIRFTADQFTVVGSLLPILDTRSTTQSS
jgi:hypothetical protein